MAKDFVQMESVYDGFDARYVSQCVSQRGYSGPCPCMLRTKYDPLQSFGCLYHCQATYASLPQVARVEMYVACRDKRVDQAARKGRK